MQISTLIKIPMLFIGVVLTACATPSTIKPNSSQQKGYPVASVLKQATIEGAEYTLLAVDDNGNIEEGLSRTLVNSPIDINNPRLVNFNGTQAIFSDAVILSATKTNVKFNEKKFYYEPGTLNVLGYKLGDDSEDKILRTVTKQYDIPQMANVGESSLVLEGNSSLWGVPDGNFIYQWALKKVNNNNANLCLIKTYRILNTAKTEIETECFTINKAGDILAKKASFFVNDNNNNMKKMYITQ